MSKTLRNEKSDPDSTRKGRNPHARRSLARTFAIVLVVAALATGARAEQGKDATNASDARPVVNVNSATVAELCYLPGVGPVLSAAIVAGRPFADLASLDKVKGIGVKKLAAMQPYVAFAGATTASAKIKVPKVAKAEPAK